MSALENMNANLNESQHVLHTSRDMLCVHLIRMTQTQCSSFLDKLQEEVLRRPHWMLGRLVVQAATTSMCSLSRKRQNLHQVKLW